MADVVGEMKIRFDVENSYVLEELARLERERDLAEATLTRVETERLDAIAERDEARLVAVTLMKQLDCWSYQAELIEAYPWMNARKNE